MRYLLDTNIVSEVSKHRPSSRVLNFLQSHETQCAIPAIVLAELFHGANIAAIEQRARFLQAIHSFLADFSDRIISFDADAAVAWAEYVSRPELRKRPRSYPDTQIAAIALAQQLVIVTRNESDFPEVPVLNPFAA